MLLVCQQCLKEFNADSSTRKYCSVECRLKAQTKTPEETEDYGKYYTAEGYECDSHGVQIYSEPTTFRQYIESWLYHNPDERKEFEDNYEKKYPKPLRRFIPKKCEDWKAFPVKWLETDEEWEQRLKDAGYESKEQYLGLVEENSRNWDVWYKECEEAIVEALMAVPDCRQDWEKIMRERRIHAKNSQFKNQN